MKFWQTVKSFVLQYKVLLALYLLITLFTYFQLTSFGHNNNFIIYRESVFHFLSGLPLYIEYPEKYFDLFYDNPVFPVLFMPFAMLPVNGGILAWILFTSLCCFLIFRYMPLGDRKNQLFMLFIMFDLMNNLGHTQTNPFLLAFMIMSWSLIEKGKPFWSAMFMALSFLIKGYGGIVGLLCFYTKDWYKMILYGLFWMLAINSLILLFVTPAQAIQYYQDWLQIISSDKIKESYSVYGWVTNFKLNIPEFYILSTALAALGGFLILHFFAGKNRTHLISFLLIWVIVFNRASEPATYIMAIGGVTLWHLSRPKNTVSDILFWVTILVSTIIPKDLIGWLDKLRYDYYIKTLLCLLVMADIYIYTAKQALLNFNNNKPATV